MSKVIELTPEIIAIMEQAGLDEVALKKLEIKAIRPTRVVKKSKQAPATEYILKSVRQCKLCGYNAITDFYMKQMEDNPSVLDARPITEDTPEGLKEDIRYKVWATCNNCESHLMSLDKLKLAQMVLKLHARRETWK